MTQPVTDEKPWYKLFWPWFLISFPLIAVILGMNMIYLAINTDDVVLDDYNKVGKAIVHNTNRDDEAALRQLKIQANFNLEQHKLIATIEGDYKGTLLFITLIHPMYSKDDIQLPVHCNQEQYCESNLPDDLSLPRNIQIEPAEKDWRLIGKLTKPVQSVSLKPKAH
ncbi:MAG: FixH family protein [bacterium]